MEIPEELQEHKQYSFEVYFRNVLINKARNLHKRNRIRQEHEALFSDLPDKMVESFPWEDEYDLSSPLSFQFLGKDFVLSNYALADAINLLLPKYKEVLLLSFFMEYSDEQIAKILNIPVSTVGTRRRSAIRRLKERMENDDDQ